MDVNGKMFHSHMRGGGTSRLWMPDIREIVSETTLSLQWQWVLLTGSKEWLMLYFLLQLKRGMCQRLIDRDDDIAWVS
ncbi:hypothetical protein DPMN_167786 [Dreissena polymorpha]|uniref:Uncharacterized protein n=1 Tax=Dreissena polymorpha TaxID=45954 RepID=A0A9D4F1E0_DREPO|nr:hypothetical protein DPMN_167786 [Dreissena polymorpha]